MSETAKTKATTTGTTKSATDSGAKSVETNTKAKATQTKQNALKTGATKQGDSNEKAKSQTSADGADDTAGGGVDSLGILGAFKVRAKSDQGFWRSGVQFLRKKETVVLVVDEEPKDQPAVLAQKGIEPELVLFMSKEKAMRVHREPNLVVENVELSDVLEID